MPFCFITGGLHLFFAGVAAHSIQYDKKEQVKSGNLSHNIWSPGVSSFFARVAA